MNTPTPRTDAEWSASFDEYSQQLETDLTALTAERDQLRAEFEKIAVIAAQTQDRNVSLKIERKQLRAELAVAQNWVQHHSKHAEDLIDENVELRAELHQLRSDCDNETKWAAHYLAQSIVDEARADKAEAELATERAKKNLWEAKCRELIAPHYILDPDLRAQKFRDALAYHPVLGAAMKEARK